MIFTWWCNNKYFFWKDRLWNSRKHGHVITVFIHVTGIVHFGFTKTMKGILFYSIFKDISRRKCVHLKKSFVLKSFIFRKASLLFNRNANCTKIFAKVRRDYTHPNISNIAELSAKLTEMSVVLTKKFLLTYRPRNRRNGGKHDVK